MNCKTHKCPFSYNSETNSLAHRGRSRKHTFQKIPACLCAGGLINYSQIHHHFSRQSVRARMRTHTHMRTLVLKSSFYTCRWAFAVQLWNSQSHSLSYTQTLCRHTWWPLPPAMADRCVHVWICVCVCVSVRACVHVCAGQADDPFLVFISFGQLRSWRDLYLALPAHYHTHVQRQQWICAISAAPPTSLCHSRT